MRRLPLTLAFISLLSITGCKPSFIKQMEKDEKVFVQRFPDSQHYYQVDGQIIHATVRDSAAPVQIVFVHGSPGAWGAWADFLNNDALAARARLVSIDRVGYGGSGDGRVDPNLEHQARALSPFLEGNQLPTILVGHSYGGPVVMKSAALFPHNLIGIVVVAGSVSPALEKHRWYNVAGSFVPVQWFLPKEMITSNREIWPLRGELEILKKQLPSVQIPTIVIQGRADDLVPYGNATYLRDTMPRGRVQIIERAQMGHLIPWEHPELIYQALDLLLKNSPANK